MIMISDIENLAIDNTNYFETWTKEGNLDNPQTFGTKQFDEKENNFDDKKKPVIENENSEENFDFTADIIDLLLCVENDENARQNIESIMDQWDEMNILGDDNGNSETNAEIKAMKSEVIIGEQKSDSVVQDSQNKIRNLIHSSTSLQNAIITSENYNCKENVQIAGNNQNLKIITKMSATEETSSSTEKLLVPLNCVTDSKIFSIQQIDASSSITAIKQTTENFMTSTSASTFKYSSSFSGNQVSSSKLENIDLSEKIRVLVCIICRKNYEQIMNSGCIPKMQYKPYPCPFCKGNYYHKSSADLHMKVHIEEETLKCRLCTNTTNNIRKNKERFCSENEISKKRVKMEMFSCLMCPIKLSTRYELDAHLAFHSKARKNNFEKQNETSSDRKFAECVILENKQKLCFQKQIDKYKCKLCDKFFTDKSNYEFHCSSHNIKFTDIFGNIDIKNSSRPTFLDHSYGKSDCAIDKRIVSTNENENMNEAEQNFEMKNTTENSDINGKNDNDIPMDMDEPVNFESVKSNEEIIHSLSPLTKNVNINEQYNLRFSTFGHCSATEETEPIYIMPIVNSLNEEKPEINETEGIFKSSYMSTDTRCLSFQDSNINLQNSCLTSLPIPSNNSMSSGSNDLHQSEEIKSSDIENVFQEHFYTQNDEKIQNDILNHNETHYPIPGQISSIQDEEKKSVVYSSATTAGTLNEFINTNMNCKNELKSNEIIQELFSSMNENRSRAGIVYQNQITQKSQCTVSSVTSDLIVQKAGSHENSNICDNMAIRVPFANVQLRPNLLFNQNRENVQDLVGLSNLSNSPISKKYIVMYVLPLSSSAQTSVSTSPTLVSKCTEQKTVIASSRNTNETYIRLPTADGKANYLVPSMNQNDAVGNFLSPSQVCNSTVDKTNGDFNGRNGDVQKVRIESQKAPSEDLKKRKINDTFPKLNANEIKINKRFINNNTSKSRAPAHREERVDPGKLHISQPPPAKQVPKEKRNILQIAYNDACKLIEDSTIYHSESQTLVQTSSVSNTAIVTSVNAAEPASSNTFSGNYTLLKQMLNSEPSILLTPHLEKDKNQKPVDISFTNDQVTFQYSNTEKDNVEQDYIATSFVPERTHEYRCEVCSNVLSKADFLPHLKTHSKTLYKCTYCKEIFVKQVNLIQHMRSHLQPQVFNCELCNKSFTNILLFRLHLLVHKGLLFICVSCIKLFNKKEDYENHLKTHSQNDLACIECKRSFPNTADSSGVKPNFTCIGCMSAMMESNQVVKAEDVRQESTNVTTIKAEIMTEIEDLCFICQYCDIICNGGVELKSHYSNHIIQEIRCVICNERFSKFVSLSVHMKLHHVTRKFSCSFCSKTFEDRRSYQEHSHLKFKPYACIACEKTFSERAELEEHVQYHKSISIVTCNYCGLKMEFGDINNIIVHKLDHKRESVVECDNCDCKFLLQSDFADHLNEVHHKKLEIGESDERLSCDKYSVNPQQRSQQVQNINEKNFVCQHCQLTYDEFNELLNHWIKLHPQNELKCFKCSCCSQFFLNELQWSHHSFQSEKPSVLLPYSLQQFNDRLFKLEPDTKSIYCCHQCNKSFGNKIDIIKHVKYH